MQYLVQCKSLRYMQPKTLELCIISELDTGKHVIVSIGVCKHYCVCCFTSLKLGKQPLITRQQQKAISSQFGFPQKFPHTSETGTRTLSYLTLIFRPLSWNPVVHISKKNQSALLLGSNIMSLVGNSMTTEVKS